MIKLLTILTQTCTIIAGLLVIVADHYLALGGYYALIAVTASTIFMIIPHWVDHLFIEVEPEGDELSCISKRLPTFQDTQGYPELIDD